MAEPQEQITRRQFVKRAIGAAVVGSGLAFWTGLATQGEETDSQKTKPPATPKPKPSVTSEVSTNPAKQPTTSPTISPEATKTLNNFDALVKLYSASSEGAGITERGGDYRPTLRLVREAQGLPVVGDDHLDILSIMMIESGYKNVVNIGGDMGPMQVRPPTVGDSVRWFSELLNKKPEPGKKLDANQQRLLSAAQKGDTNTITKLLYDAKTATFAGVTTYLFYEHQAKDNYAKDFSPETQRDLTIVSYNGGIGWINEMVDFYRRHSPKEDIPKAKWLDIASFCLAFAPQFCREETGRVLAGVKPEGKKGLYELVDDVALYLARATHTRWAHEEGLKALAEGKNINPIGYFDRVWEKVRKAADESKNSARWTAPNRQVIAYGVPTIPLKSYIA